jgi:hypothetical protein
MEGARLMDEQAAPSANRAIATIPPLPSGDEL